MVNFTSGVFFITNITSKFCLPSFFFSICLFLSFFPIFISLWNFRMCGCKYTWLDWLIAFASFQFLRDCVGVQQLTGMKKPFSLPRGGPLKGTVYFSPFCLGKKRIPRTWHNVNFWSLSMYHPDLSSDRICVMLDTAQEDYRQKLLCGEKVNHLREGYAGESALV